MIHAFLCCFVSVPVAGSDELRPLFRAIQAVETSGVEAPGRAVGDNGRSIGPYQITRAYWADSGVSGKWTWCRGHAYSEAVMMAYWRRHCPAALRQRNFEVLARIHNGGPTGPMKHATGVYWRKVGKKLIETTSSTPARRAATVSEREFGEPPAGRIVFATRTAKPCLE